MITVTWEGEFFRKVHTSIFGRIPSLPQHCSTLEEFEEEFARIEYRLAKAYAYKRLAAMSMLSSNLVKSLQTRLVSKEVAERVVEEFLKLGYLNDHEWVKSFIRQQVSKKTGPKMIAAKLAAKGVSSELSEQYMEELSESQDQRSAIQALLKTKYRTRDLSDFKQKQKVIASLARRGFDIRIILDAF
jgi:regulatory protein